MTVAEVRDANRAAIGNGRPSGRSPLTSRCRVLVVVAVVVTAIAGGAAVVLRGPTSGIERTTVDWRFQLRDRRDPPYEVAILAIDSRTAIKLQRRLPPSRALQARVVRRLTQAGARVIAYDLALNGVTTPDDDLAIIGALKHARSAVVSVTRFDASGGTDLLAGLVRFGAARVRPGNTLRLVERNGTWIHFIPAVGQLDSFPVAAGAAYLGVGRLTLPPRGLIDYHGPPGTVPRLSFIDVLDGRVSPSALRRTVRGKVVVVGNTAPELSDVHDVPVGTRMSGPELQANAIATAIDGFPLRVVSSGAITLTTFAVAAVESLVLLGLALVALRRGRGAPSPLSIVCIGILAVAAWAVVAQFAFDRGTVVAFTPGVTAIFLTTGLTWGLSPSRKGPAASGRSIAARWSAIRFAAQRRDGAWLGRVPESGAFAVYLLRMIRLGAPWLAGRLGLLGTLVGLTATGIAARLASISPFAAVAGVLLALLAILSIGGYRLWHEGLPVQTDDGRSDRVEPEDRRLLTKNVFTVQLQVAENYLREGDTTPEAIVAWIADMRDMVRDAFGLYEMHRFMGGQAGIDAERDVPLFPDRVAYLRDLLERADQLPLSSDFDPAAIQRTWAGHSQASQEEQDDGAVE